MLRERVAQTHGSALGEAHPETIEANGLLANLHSMMGRYEEAERLQRLTYETAARAPGATTPLTLWVMTNLGQTRQKRGDVKGATELLERALEVKENALGHDHPGTLVTLAPFLVCAYLEQGLRDLAASHLSRALAKERRRYGAEHRRTLGVALHLTDVLERQGRMDEAEPLAESTLRAFQALMGEAHLGASSAMSALAGALQRQRRNAEASMLIERASETFTRTLGAEHPYTLVPLGNAGQSDATARPRRCTAARSRARSGRSASTTQAVW